MPATILTFVDHYLPGMKAGGPVRSIAHVAEQLGTVYRFRILTRDRDFGDPAAYPDLPRGTWRPVGRAEAMYLPPERVGVRGIRRVLRETPHDLLYLNSLFSSRMTFVPLLLRRMGVVPRRPVVLAPRGELHRGALSTGTWWGLLPGRIAGALVTPRFLKKWLYLRVCRALGLFRDVVWQASTEGEAADVRRWIGPGAVVTVAADLAGEPPRLPPRRTPKEPGLLRLVYLSRIAQNKNLLGVLRLLGRVRARVEFDVYGPIADAGYWERCRRAFSALPPNVRVRFHGAVEHARVAQVLRDHELMILPTWGENYGHVILEALAAGCPVLVSDQTPWRGLEAAGVGWDLPLADEAPFVEALERVAAMDDREHALWSRRAEEFARRHAGDLGVVERSRALFARALGGDDAPAVSAASAAFPARGIAALSLPERS